MRDTLDKHHPLSPNGVDEDVRNDSGNPDFARVLQARLSRRGLLKGGFALAASSLMGAAAAASDHAPKLTFKAVPKHTRDALALPPGYRASVLYRTGDPIRDGLAEYGNDGADDAAGFAWRAGDNHDGMHYFPLDAERGLLCVNHENITQVFLHRAEEVAAGLDRNGRVAAQIDKEVNAHGVSIVEVVRQDGQFRIDRQSRFNRRLTAATPMEIHGPARGHRLLATRYAPDGTRTRGTLNNCAGGYTPWGTYLTCEENWAGYFKRPASATLDAGARAARERYFGAKASNGSYGWANPVGGGARGDDRYRRWDLTPGERPELDYRQAANGMGWVVEIDPFDPDSVPRKRSALGRFGHEGAMPARIVAGRPLVYYMGDDARGEYLYKYVSRRDWDPLDARRGGLDVGDRYLDDGRLYAARFDADGRGAWVELSLADARVARHPGHAFADQADVLIHCRLAADAVGATPLDRPEWTGVHPSSGDLYVTLTNNSRRGQVGGQPLDAANPRHYLNGAGHAGNPNGHILRLREDAGDPAATAFTWDVYLFGAEAGLDAGHVNLSGLDDDNDFSSPDGLWFSQAHPGLMWIQTDDDAYADASNCMMLAALPGRQGDGGAVNITSAAVPAHGGRDQTVATRVGRAASPETLRRFLVGPIGCEITGVCETPDGRALFVNIQHPGQGTPASEIANPFGYQSHWPDGGDARPRSATLVITRDDGGPVGL